MERAEAGVDICGSDDDDGHGSLEPAGQARNGVGQYSYSAIGYRTKRAFEHAGVQHLWSTESVADADFGYAGDGSRLRNQLHQRRCNGHSGRNQFSTVLEQWRGAVYGCRQVDDDEAADGTFCP